MEINKKTIFFFSSHNLFFVENLTEHMLFLAIGKIIFDDTPLKGLGDTRIKNLLGSYDDLLSLIKNS